LSQKLLEAGKGCPLNLHLYHEKQEGDLGSPSTVMTPDGITAPEESPWLLQVWDAALRRLEKQTLAGRLV